MLGGYMPDIILESAYGIGSLLAILIALAAASRLVASVGGNPLIRSVPIPGGRVAGGVLWLALGALFAMPLLDLLGFLRSLADISTRALWNPEINPAATPWGTAPWGLYLLLANLLLLAAYITTFACLWAPLNRRTHPGNHGRLPRWATAYMVAVVASLLYRLLQATVLRVVWLQLPTTLPSASRGVIGFSIGWVLGLLFLLFVILLFPKPIVEEQGEIPAA
jgi:hypothetical protein